VTSNARRGAELDGASLAYQLSHGGIDATAMALTDAPNPPRLDLPSLGAKPLGVRTLLRLRSVVSEYDLVIAYGSQTLPACALACAHSTPFVYRSIGDPSVWCRGPLHRWRTGLLFRRASGVVALWPEAASWIAEHHGVDRVFSVFNARDSDRFALRSEARSTDRKLNGPLCVFIGALVQEKRPELAVKIIAELSDCSLRMAGDGPLRRGVQQLAVMVAPGRVECLGAIEDVRPLLEMADVLLCTSETEGMPGVVIEALLMGVPVVASRVGALEAMSETIHLVDVDALPVTWASATRRALDAQPKDLGAAQRFSWTSVRADWLDVVDSVVGVP